MRKEVAADIRSVFDARDINDANRILKNIVEKYHKSASKLSHRMEESIPEGLSVFKLPANRRKKLRT